MINETIKQAILDHYAQEYPRECCGLIVDEAYIPCTNVATSDSEFEIDALDFIQCAKLGTVRAIVHSHPDGTTRPSIVDKIQMQLHGVPWVITDGHDVATHHPEDHRAPLLGRDYLHGSQDCYTLIQDYYQRELGILLSDYDRKDAWWLDKTGPSLYLDNFQEEGFVQVQDIQKHDLILCNVGRTYHPNHGVIFLGDGTLTSEKTPGIVGNQLILHHPYGRDSVREIYGHQWQQRTALVLRHKALIK